MSRAPSSPVTVTAETVSKRNWSYRVVKRMRGIDGEYFDFPTALTFAGPSALHDAEQYAEAFARQQGAARVYGARIVVRTRKGNASVAEYRSESYMARPVELRCACAKGRARSRRPL